MKFLIPFGLAGFVAAIAHSDSVISEIEIASLQSDLTQCRSDRDVALVEARKVVREKKAAVGYAERAQALVARISGQQADQAFQLQRAKDELNALRAEREQLRVRLAAEVLKASPPLNRISPRRVRPKPKPRPKPATAYAWRWSWE
jgi:uncharacterized protein (DUF3084 family)